MSVILLIILGLIKIDLAYMASVDFKISLAPAKIQLDCGYNLDKNEIKIQIIYRKDGEQFAKVDYVGGKVTTTTIDGIDLVKTYGGCKLDILNYSPLSLGIYELNLKYTDSKGKSQSIVKRSKLSLKVDKCQYQWVESSTGKLPNNHYVAGLNFNMSKLIICKNSNSDIGYLVSEGCLQTTGKNIVVKTTYQVLCGKGFGWAMHTGDNQNVPTNALALGEDWTGKMYMGKCNSNGEGHIGQITNGFYFNSNGVEVQDCPTRQILLCSP